jgi:hypothetical protein
VNELKQYIDNMIFSKMKNYKDLSNETGVPESTISKWLTHGSEISAFSFTKIICALHPDDKCIQEQLTFQYLQSLKEGSSLNPKILFLISYLNRNMKVFHHLIEKCSCHRYKSVRKYAEIFQLYRLRLEGGNIKKLYLEIDPIRKGITKKERDVEVLCDILSMIILLDLGEIKLVEIYRKKIKKNFNKMGKSFLKVIYRFWVDELFSYYLLRKNEVEKFRRYYNILRFQKDLKFFFAPIIQSSLDLKAGESHLLSNEYNKAVMLLESSLQIFEKWGDHSRYKQALNDIHFLRIKEWKDIDKLDFKTMHLAELAFYYIKLEEYEKANILLDELEGKYGYLTAVQTCYRGMAKFDTDLIRKSIEMLKKNNDFFFVKFAEQMYDEYVGKSKIML